MRNKQWLGLVIFITVNQVIASEQAEEQTVKESAWNSEAELGLVKTTGNTETETYRIQIEGQRDEISKNIRICAIRFGHH